MKPHITSDLENFDYETALVIVAQWCQPTLDISINSVGKELDKLATASLSHLLELHPNHPIFTKIRSDQPDLNNVTSNHWNPKDCHQILSSVNHILYVVEGYTGNTGDYYNPDNSYINK